MFSQAQMEDLTNISKRLTSWGRRPRCVAVRVWSCLALRTCCCRDKPATLEYLEGVGVLGEDCTWMELSALAWHLGRPEHVVWRAVAYFLEKEEEGSCPRFGLCWTKNLG